MEEDNKTSSKQRAVKKLIDVCGGEPEARIPVYALTSLFSARVFGYVEGKSRDKPVGPPSSGGQDGKADESKDRGKFGSNVHNRGPKYQTVCVGDLSKKDMQILFALMCLTSKKPEAELNWVQPTQGAGAVIPKTETNQVCMPAKMCAMLASALYGRGARESTDLFIRDLRKMSCREFSVLIPVNRWHAIEYNTIPLSIAIINDVHLGDGGGGKTFAGIAITLSDIFFYKSRHKYGVFNIEAMFKGLKGKNSDLFAMLVSYASRFLPTVAMQRKKGKGYRVSVPIEKICPGYNTSAKQNKQRTRKNLLKVGAGASPLLLSVSVTLADDSIKCEWGVCEKTQQSDECEVVKT